MCLAQGHNAVTPVRLEPTALLYRVKPSTTEALSVVFIMLINVKMPTIVKQVVHFAVLGLKLYCLKLCHQACACPEVVHFLHSRGQIKEKKKSNLSKILIITSGL